VSGIARTFVYAHAANLADRGFSLGLVGSLAGMDKSEQTLTPPKLADEVRGAERSTPPRGNPETDHDSVRKGEQQLEKVSGH
jgi:hypothetical protein